MNELTKAAQDVLNERHRQVETEGWTREHDDTHDDFELSAAGAAYALHAGPGKRGYAVIKGLIPEWLVGIFPWSHEAWNPGPDSRRALVKAGALILAEIERLDRAKEPSNDR